MALTDLRVLSLESRRATETAELIRKQGGIPVVAPSMREVPVEHNEEAIRFGESLIAGAFDMTIFLTGVGARFLFRVLETRFTAEAIREALERTTIVVRGSKPSAAIRDYGLRPALIAPEPNTWHEVLEVIKDRLERRIAIQEYGRPSTELYDALRARGAEVTPVVVYQWDLPEDITPLEDAARRLAAREIDVVMFTSSVQFSNLMTIADRLGLSAQALAGLRSAVVASIGPTTSEALSEAGIACDLEPTHPKLGILVKELSDCASNLLAAKRA